MKCRKFKVRFSVIALLVVIVLMVLPIWNVQIEGSEIPRDMCLLVVDKPSANYPRLANWTLLPPTTLNDPVWGELKVVYEWHPNEGQSRPYWNELDREIEDELQAFLPLALNGALNGQNTAARPDVVTVEVLLKNGAPLIAHRSLVQIDGDLTYLRDYGDYTKMYGGAQVQISRQWLTERHSLATILWSKLKGSQAENVIRITLFGAGT